MRPADRVLAHALARPATLGAARVVCVDGPSGSGKSTLARVLAATATVPVHVVATDELLPGGWDGLPGLGSRIGALLASVSAGREGWWRRWDWVADGWAEWHRVPGGGVLVLEGTGSWHPAYACLVTTSVWVEAPRTVRLARGVARDDGMVEHWRRWSAAEDALHRRLRTRARADLRVST